MKRKALIIAVPGDEGQKDYLPGTIQDSINYKKYLMSPKGGQWYENEIDISKNIKDLDWAFKKIIFNNINYDYTFIVFTGHGYHNGDENIQYIHLYGGSERPISDFYHRSCRRQTIIIDACRKVYTTDKKGFMKKSIFSESLKIASDSRELFDNKVMNSEEGIIKLYSSSKNQASGDSEYGGLFSRSLIKAGEDWNDSDKDVLDIYDAFTLSKENLSFLDPIQKPEIDAGKRLEYFPFAVK